MQESDEPSENKIQYKPQAQGKSSEPSAIMKSCLGMRSSVFIAQTYM